MAKKDQGTLPNVSMGPTDARAAYITPPRYPLWTEHKAQLVTRYLRYFVFITKHGTYIDGFAGPQSPDHLDTWAAKLVLESRPRWLRHFHLCEQDRDKVLMLQALRDEQPLRAAGEPRREVAVYPAGDFNETVDVVLTAGIPETEATFCLLDQRTFECEWETVRKLACHKQGRKIELFYFLAQGWIDRAFAAQKDEARLDAWWGNDEWKSLRNAPAQQRANMMVDRIRTLGYEHVLAWPIYEARDSARVMYFMVHASDHPEAPGLMSRAYRNAVSPPEPMAQLALDFNVDIAEIEDEEE